MACSWNVPALYSDSVYVCRQAGAKKMANESLTNLVAWCKRERESLQMQREMLQSGKFRIFKNEGSGQVDTSSDSIERITANIIELDAILADYEARGSRA
jgi:hypothetical protein